MIPWLAQAALAQAGTSAGEGPAGPALQGETTPIQGAPNSAPPPQPGGGSGFSFILPLLAVLVVVMVLSSMTGRKERRRREQLLRDLSKGDRVQTLGGIIGTVIELTDQEMVLRVDEASNTRIRFSRSAVQQVIKSAREKDGKPAERPEPPQVETRSSTPARV